MADGRADIDVVRKLSAPQIFRHVERICECGPRPIWSSGDDEAVRYLEEQLRQGGARVETASFGIAASKGATARLEVISPEPRSLRCEPNYRSAPSPPQGIRTNRVVDVGYGTPEGYEGKQVAGAIVVATEGGMHSVPKSQLAARSGAIGCIWIRSEPGGLIATYGLERFGSRIPVVSISYEDGQWLRCLVSSGTPTLSLRVDSRLEEVKAEHLIGIVEGKKRPGEVVVLCCHRETVPGSPGANDNASGVAVVLEVLKALTSSQVDRTVWGLFSTGEEGGAIGLRAFVADNTEQVKRIKAVLNVDCVGEGSKLVFNTKGTWPDRTVLASDTLNRILAGAAVDLGYEIVPSVSEMGLADAEPFIEAGIPGTYIERVGWRHLHTSDDLPETLDVNGLKVAADVLLLAITRMDQHEGLANQ
jgi:aminopeptidase YwaD